MGRVVRVEGLRELLERERVPYPERERLFLVLGLLLTGRISMGKAAELLGLRVDELWLLLRRMGVEYSIVDEEEVEEELDEYKEVFKGGS
jgi:predicted HTH domain antitoxin